MVFSPLKDCPCPLCGTNLPTVRAAPNFNAEADAVALRAAMKGFGCDNEEITSVLAHRSATQRGAIEDAYKSLHGRDLIEDLQSELGGNFERLVIALMHPWPQFGARAVKKACKGLGTAEQVLIDVLCTAKNCEINMIKEAFHEMYEDSIEELLEKELSDDFLHLMVAVVQAARHEDDAVDENKAKEDAAAIHEAGELKYGTDESTFTRVLVRNSYAQLHAVSKAYEALAGKTLQEAVESELSGSMLNAAKAILGVAKNKDLYWAERLHSCMAGLGTDDKALINILVARSEIDLGNIKKEFQKVYETPLDTWIEDECSGDYKKMLLAIVSD